MRWTTQLTWTAGGMEQRRLEALRLLRLVPAITELTLLDASGREQLKVSRLAMDVIGSQTDHSREAASSKVWAKGVPRPNLFSPRRSEPYMTSRWRARVAMPASAWPKSTCVHLGCRLSDQGRRTRAGLRRRCAGPPDRPSRDQPGPAQYRFLAAGPGPGRACSFAKRPASRSRSRARRRAGPCGARGDCSALDWLVFVELPSRKPTRRSTRRSCVPVVLVAALGWRCSRASSWRAGWSVPFEALQRMRRGLAPASSTIASRSRRATNSKRLASSSTAWRPSCSVYATLERKVEERTHQLELANLAKSRFLAAASHDLRQPLHAWVCSLRSCDPRWIQPTERSVIARIEPPSAHERAVQRAARHLQARRRRP